MSILELSVITVSLFRLILFLVASIVSYRYDSSNNKNSPFECGFDPKENARAPFSLRFFLLAIIFLVFDIEIALLFPIVLIIKRGLIYQRIFRGIFFFIILLLGLFHEWNEGSLSWVKYASMISVIFTRKTYS